MAKVACIDPGPGSQQPGMGAELLTDPESSDLCDRCSSSSDVDLRRLLTTADDDELRLTQNAQPALCFVGIGLTILLRRHGIDPVAAAGHSVGEYTALAASGAVSAHQVIQAVFERREAIAGAAPPRTSPRSPLLRLPAPPRD